MAGFMPMIYSAITSILIAFHELLGTFLNFFTFLSFPDQCLAFVPFPRVPNLQQRPQITVTQPVIYSRMRCWHTSPTQTPCLQYVVHLKHPLIAKYDVPHPEPNLHLTKIGISEPSPKPQHFVLFINLSLCHPHKTNIGEELSMQSSVQSLQALHSRQHPPWLFALHTMVQIISYEFRQRAATAVQPNQSIGQVLEHLQSRNSPYSTFYIASCMFGRVAEQGYSAKVTFLKGFMSCIQGDEFGAAPNCSRIQ